MRRLCASLFSSAARAFLFLFFLTPSDCSATYKFVLLVEGPHSDGLLPETFACGLRAAERRLDGGTALEEAVVSVRDDTWSEAEEEALEAEARGKLCQLLSGAPAAVLDLTRTEWPEARKLTVPRGVPYVRVEPTLSSFLRATEAVIAAKGASDAALVFASEREVDEAIALMVGRSLLRALVLNRLGPETIGKLLRMRPAPSYHVIFAGASDLERIFAEATAGGLVPLDDRWILTVTDLGRPKVETAGRQVTLLSPSKDSCCAFSAEGECDRGACRGAERSEEGGGGRGWSGGEGGRCGPQMESMFVERMIELLAEAATAASEASASVARPPPAPEGANVSLDACGSFSSATPPPKEFYAAVERMAAASSSIGAAEASSGLWSNNASSLVLFPRLSIDVEVLSTEEQYKVATWRSEGPLWSDSGLALEPHRSLPPQRPFLRVGIVEMVPWAYLEEGTAEGGGSAAKGGGVGRWTGYCIDFVKALAERMAVDYEVVAYRGGDFGERRADGSWDGAIGGLAKGETDLLVASTVMTSEREEVIDFVAPYFEQTGISIVIRKPVKKTSLFKFMTVLRLEVWLSIVGALSVTGMMIWFLDKYSPYSAQNNRKMYPYPCRKFTLKESFWFALTSFTPQGGGEAPKALSSRTLVAAYWLFVVLMLATFTANLAAFLTVERMQSPVQSLEQLARQSRINYTVVENSTTHQYFINMRNAEDTLYRVWKEITLNSTSNLSRYRVWDYPIKEQYGHILLAIEQTGPVSSAAEGFRKVMESESGEFAFIHDASQVRYETSRNCNFTEVGEPFAEQPFAIAVQTGSHLQEELSRRILDLQKDRFFESLTAKYWNASSKGQCPNSEDTEGITLESLGGVFIATLFGLALAMVTLAGEIVYYRRRRARAEREAEGKEGRSKEAERRRKKGRRPSFLKRERFGVAKQRARKVAAAPLPSVSINDRFHFSYRNAVEDISQRQNFRLSRKGPPRVSFEPVYREDDATKHNKNAFMLNRDIW